MTMKVTFLGTAGAIPTQKRSLPSVVLQCGNELLMFDCGEGAQRQMLTAKVGYHKEMRIFITHMHGDHVLGLPGLLQTMALMDRQRGVDVYGPVGIAHFLECLQETLQFAVTYPMQIHEVSDAGLVCDTENYAVTAAKSNHVLPSFAFCFQEKPRAGKFHPEKAKALGVSVGEAFGRLQRGETIQLPNGTVVQPSDVADAPRKGRKIIYTGDTRPFPEFAAFAAEADLVVHESTFDDALAEKAQVDGHSTPSQAAKETAEAHAKKLVLTHISARYSDSTILVEQAKKFFADVVVAEDFLELELPLSE